MDENLASGFYEINAYRSNSDRYRNGIDQLNSIQAMVKERADIEATYSRAIAHFNDRWVERVSRTTCGAVQQLWLSLLKESAELQNLHANVKDRIINEDNFHPSPLRAPKEVKEIEDSFEKAQRPWRKQLEKVEKCKKAYYVAAQKENCCKSQVANGKNDPSLSEDSRNKQKERYQKAKEECSKAERTYHDSLETLHALKNSYISHMDDAFEVCQQNELKRLKFVNEMLLSMHNVLCDLYLSSKLKQLHEKLDDELKRDDDLLMNDLNVWSKKSGPLAPMSWPKFEPYTPSMHGIASKKKSGDDGIVLLRQTNTAEEELGGSIRAQRRFLQRPYSAQEGPSHNGPAGDITKSYADLKFKRPVSSIDRKVNQTLTNGTNNDDGSMNGITTPADEADKVVPSKHVDDVLCVGIVKHDYEAVEPDELTIHRGEAVEILSPPNAQNWVLGRKDGRVGLFPNGFVEKT